MAPSPITVRAHVLRRDAHARAVAAPIVVILLAVLLLAAVVSSLIIWLKRRLRATSRTIIPFEMGITLGAGAGDRDMENVTTSLSLTTPSSFGAGVRLGKDAAVDVSGRAFESGKSTFSAVCPTSIQTVGTSASKRVSSDAVPLELTKSSVLAAGEPESRAALDMQTPVVRIRPASSQSQGGYDRHLITARATTPTIEVEMQLSVQASRLVELQTEIGRVGFSVEELLSSLSRLHPSADVESDPDAPPPTYDMRI